MNRLRPGPSPRLYRGVDHMIGTPSANRTAIKSPAQAKSRRGRALRPVIFLVCVMGALFPNATIATVEKASKSMPMTEVDQKKIDAVFSTFAPKGPGCALGITENLKTVYEKGFGLANLDFGTPINSDTSFDIASVSKQFTAMSVMILAHEGKISLNDDVRKYIPELPVYGRPITIRNLIYHTSGLRDIYMLRSLMGLTEKDYFTEVEFLDDVARQKHLVFPTGEGWRYSNTGYLLLGMIVKRATHSSLAQYAQEKIFGPLNMTDTFFADDAARIVKNRATGYYRQPDGSFKRGITLLEIVGDGGVVSTVHDMMLWDRDFYIGKVWKPEIKAEMLAPGHLNNGELAGAVTGGAYAAGLVVGARRGLNYVRHSGSFVGFKTDQLRFPDQKLGVTVLCNLDEADAATLSDRVADIVLERSFTSPAPSNAANRNVSKYERVPVPGKLLDEFAGFYHSDELGVSYRILRKDDSIRLLMGKRATPLETGDYAASPFGLIAPDTIGDEVFAFKILRKDTKIVGFGLSLAGGSPMRFERVEAPRLHRNDYRRRLCQSRETGLAFIERDNQECLGFAELVGRS